MTKSSLISNQYNFNILNNKKLDTNGYLISEIIRELFENSSTNVNMYI